MKKYFGLFLALLLTVSVQAADKDWKLYLSYHDALNCQVAGKEVYADFGGNLLAYHPDDGEVRLLSKLDGLNGRNILFMDYSATQKCLVLLYDNFQIDLLYTADGSVVGLPQIKDSQMDGLVANSLFVDGDDAVLAMNNGVVHLNLNRQEIVGYYVLKQNVCAAAYHNRTLYAAGDEDLYICSLDGNPLDISEWSAIGVLGFDRFVSNGKSLYAIVSEQREVGATPGLWLMNDDGESFRQISKEVFTHAEAQHGKLVVANDKKVHIYDAAQPEVAEQQISFPNSWNDVSRSADGTFWASEGTKGLQGYQLSGSTFKKKGDVVGNYGPRRDLCYYMRYVGPRLLIAGGRLDPYDRQHNPGTIMEYTRGQWKVFQEDGISDQTGISYRDITSIAVDPKDENHVFATSGGTGLYEFKDYQFVAHISNHNSPLESAAGGDPYYVRLDGLNFDDAGNMWLVNNTSEDTILRARRPDGTWKSFYFESIRKAPTCEKTLIDSKKRLWVASRRTVSNHTAGLFCLDYNSTLDKLDDDVSTYRKVFVNQDGKSYSTGGVYCMAEDADGAIWVGTKAGLFVISNPDDWHKPDFHVTQIKVPRNDGTNLADYLLSEIPISAIAIDGAGRKWIGTETQGLYLVSPDGTEVLEHFEETNSPLLSNYIYSLAPNMETGEIMIGTDKGLCSYQSSATMPEPALQKDKVKVYPNPVRPEYHGNVRVTGLTDNAEVKVVTTSGEVVAMGVSTGGTFVWDVRGGDGARVAAGIYYLMIATSDGDKGIVTKILVI